MGDWTIDELDRSAAADSSGNGYDLIGDEAPTSTVGQIGGAFQLDGVDDSIDVNSINDAFDENQGSLSLWMYREFADTVPDCKEVINFRARAANSIGIFYSPIDSKKG